MVLPISSGFTVFWSVIMNIHESAEMYLETIHVIKLEKGIVHAVDIARKMNFSKPSVSVSVHALEKDGYISISDSGEINLLKKGQKIADKIYERHTVVGGLLTSLGVSEENAYADACKIEHDISDETFACFKKLYESQMAEKN